MNANSPLSRSGARFWIVVAVPLLATALGVYLLQDRFDNLSDSNILQTLEAREGIRIGTDDFGKNWVIYVHGPEVTDDDFRLIAQLSNLSAVHIISSTPNLTSECLRHLASSQTLGVFSIRECDQFDATWLDALQQMTHLPAIFFWDISLDFEVPIDIRPPDSLKKVYMAGCQIGDSFCDYLARGKIEDLSNRFREYLTLPQLEILASIPTLKSGILEAKKGSDQAEIERIRKQFGKPDLTIRVEGDPY